MSISDAIRSVVSGPQPQDTPLSIEDASLVIDNQRRRLVVDILAESELSKLRLGDLTEAIASAEYQKPPDQLSSEERKRIHVALYQTHLDKMDEIDVVEFDKDRGTITVGSAFDHAERVLESIREECDGGGA